MLKGKDVILFIEVGQTWKAVACSTECDIDIQAQTLDANLGGWRNSKQRRLSWSMRGSFLVPSLTPQDSPIAMAINKQKLRVMISSVQAHPEEVLPSEFVIDTRARYTGYGYISSVRLSANNGDKTVYSLDIAGTGALSLA